MAPLPEREGGDMAALSFLLGYVAITAPRSASRVQTSAGVRSLYSGREASGAPPEELADLRDRLFLTTLYAAQLMDEDFRTGGKS